MKINYKEKRFISEEEQNSRDIEFMVEDTKLQFQKDLLETKKEYEAARLLLADLKTNYPLDVQAIIDAQIDVENYSDAITRMDELAEEFGFDK